MKILQYIRRHVKNSATQIAHYNTLEICEMFVYKHTETIEYIKK